MLCELKSCKVQELSVQENHISFLDTSQAFGNLDEGEFERNDEDNVVREFTRCEEEDLLVEQFQGKSLFREYCRSG